MGPRVVVKPSVSRDVQLQASPSKSHTHRALLLGAMAPGRSQILDLLISEDTLATLRVVEALGAQLSYEGALLPITDLSPGSLSQVEIEGGNLNPPEAELDCANSGTTLRLATGLASTLEGRTCFTGDASLRARPNKPLLEALESLGVTTTSSGGRAPLCVRGPWRAEQASIQGDISSQFISALILGAIATGVDFHLALSTPLKSEPYVKLTCNLVREFGGSVEAGDAERHEFRVLSGTLRPTRCRVPGDFSSASFPLAVAALGRTTAVLKGLQSGSAQGDSIILEWLRQMGCSVHWQGDVLTVAGSELQAITCDMGNTPDLVPIMAVLGAFASGTMELENCAHARLKESDRLGLIAENLRKMGADLTEREDGLTIHGGKSLKGISLTTEGDHRILMALAVAATCAEGSSTLDHPNCNLISYPDFWGDFRAIGCSFSFQ